MYIVTTYILEQGELLIIWIGSLRGNLPGGTPFPSNSQSLQSEVRTCWEIQIFSPVSRWRSIVVKLELKMIQKISVIFDFWIISIITINFQISYDKSLIKYLYNFRKSFKTDCVILWNFLWLLPCKFRNDILLHRIFVFAWLKVKLNYDKIDHICGCNLNIS